MAYNREMLGRLDSLRKRSPSWYGLALIAVLAYVLWVVVVPLSAATEVVAQLLLVGTRTWAAMTILGISALIKPIQGERAWRFFGTGLSLWAMAEAIRFAGWAITGAPLDKPSIVDVFHVAGYLSMMAAMIFYPAKPPERFGRIRGLLELLILILSVLALSWMVFVRPVLEVGLAGPITTFWIAIRPVMGFILLWLSFRLILLDAASYEISALRILGIGVLVTAISDLSDSYILLVSFSRSASLVEAGWMGANLLFLEVSRRMRKLSTGERDAFEDDLQPWPHSLEPLLPIVLTYAVVGYSALDWWFSGQVDWFGVATAVVLSLMLVARQGIIVGQSELSQFIALVNDSADMAFICEPEGLVRLANPALRQAIGVPPSMEESLQLADFLVGEEGTSALISQTQKDGWTGEVWFRHRNGHTLPVSLSLRPVSVSHQPKTLLAATAHDLTAIREREIVLRTALNEVAEARGELEALNVELEDKIGVRTRELESTVAEMAVILEELKVLDRMKTEFVALVSHELRAPLTNILSGVELILDSEHELTLSARESLKLVQAETQRLARLVATVLDMSALEAGQFPISFNPISVEDVARKVYGRFLETDVSERLCLDLPHDLPDVLADEQALDSVFFHLLDNAFKYAPKGEISIEAWEEGIYVYVSVCDAGPGIPSNERERVFDMFHRVDARDSREVYGYGLGLPMARRFMEAMEGGIKVEDGPRGGARLVFWLKQAV